MNNAVERKDGVSATNQPLVPASQQAIPRKIPLPSRIVNHFMHAIYAALYVILKPLGLAPTAVAGASGGLFGLLMLPSAVLYALLYVLKTYLLPGHGLIHDGLAGVLWTFCLWYLGTIVMDDAHSRVTDTGFDHPRGILHRLSYHFFLEIFNYFPMTCQPTNENVKQLLTPNRQYVFGVHPHGIHCWALTLFASPQTPFDDMFPGLVSGSSVVPMHPLTGLAATVMFKIPVVREFFLAFGYIDARRQVADAALKAGRSIFVVTGGEEESMMTGHNSDTGFKEDVVVLKHRKGFIRLALRHGAALVPVFGVGLNDAFRTYSWGIGLRRWIQKSCRIALPIFHGRWFTPLPYRNHIRVIIGEPILTPMPTRAGAQPDEAVVAEYHQKYIEALKQLHAQHVHDRPLRIT